MGAFVIGAAEADFGEDQRILFGDKAPVFRPLFFPGLAAFLRVRVTDIANTRCVDRIVRDVFQIVRPVKTRDERNGGVTGFADGGDEFFHHVLPLTPCAAAKPVACDGGFVEQFKKCNRGVALVTRRDGLPERQRFIPRGIIHYMLIAFILQVADTVPVDDHIQLLRCREFDTFVEQFQVFFLPAFPPCGRMHGKPHDVRAPAFHFPEVAFVPVTDTLELVGVAGVQSAEYDRTAIGRDKTIAFDADLWELGLGGHHRSRCKKEEYRKYPCGYFHRGVGLP